MNLQTYERAETADWYAKAAFFFGAEQRLLDELGDRIHNMDMLDIGVGGGRTTDRFAPLVKTYVGTDYASAMVRACEEKYGGKHRFICCDAREMSVFPDAHFDFVLFSFNGIDYVPYEDRAKVLREVRRVSRPGATFAFSTHNLNSADIIFRWRRMAALHRDFARFALLWLLNLGYLVRRPRDHAMINDGVHRFSLRTHYIAPIVQIEQLLNEGFRNIRILAQSGEEVDPNSCSCPQPYFVCEVT